MSPAQMILSTCPQSASTVSNASMLAWISEKIATFTPCTLTSAITVEEASQRSQRSGEAGLVPTEGSYLSHVDDAQPAPRRSEQPSSETRGSLRHRFGDPRSECLRQARKF